MDGKIENKKKIFLIDDDVFLLGMYAMKFEKKGFETKVSSNGSEAMEILRGGYSPDVLIMDLIMPVMDGFSLYESIKREGLVHDCLVVMLTNQSTVSDINRAKELGVDGFIVKATSIPSEVVDKVITLLKNK